MKQAFHILHVWNFTYSIHFFFKKNKYIYICITFVSFFIRITLFLRENYFICIVNTDRHTDTSVNMCFDGHFIIIRYTISIIMMLLRSHLGLNLMLLLPSLFPIAFVSSSSINDPFENPLISSPLPNLTINGLIFLIELLYESIILITQNKWTLDDENICPKQVHTWNFIEN